MDDGVRDIPPLLQGQPPPSRKWANLGTQEYGEKIEAVVVVGGYNDADLERLREACKGKTSVPWLRHHVGKDVDPRQPRPKVGIEYGEQIAKRVVSCLNHLREDSQMKEDGLYWF